MPVAHESERFIDFPDVVGVGGVCEEAAGEAAAARPLTRRWHKETPGERNDCAASTRTPERRTRKPNNGEPKMTMIKKNARVYQRADRQ